MTHLDLGMADSGAGGALGSASGDLPRDIAELIGRFDHVTRLPNRLQFLSDFTGLVASGPAPVVVMVTLADARHYNEILRALGHAFAEDMVRAGAVRLAEVVSAGMRIYHVSVLSFAFVLPTPDEPEDSGLVAAVVGAFSKPLRVNDIPIKTRVGVGVMSASLGSDPAEVLRAALAAAQDSRRRDIGWAWYDHRSDAANQRAFRILADLPDAIADRGQLALHLQPRVDLGSGRCIGAEALLRWTHPQLGAISPGEFVPLAEQTALIGPLTDWVLRAAIDEAAALDRNGHPLRVSINASPLDLSDAGFDERVMARCADAQVPPELIGIEFTEGTVAANMLHAADQLQRLRSWGIEVSIDDFGSGFANMSYLTTIPADVLKIDQGLIRPMSGSERSRFVVRQIVQLARGLGYKVCAEGIETGDVLDWLKADGCDEGQGYFLARPMAAPRLLDWLATQSRI